MGELLIEAKTFSGASTTTVSASRSFKNVYQDMKVIKTNVEGAREQHYSSCRNREGWPQPLICVLFILNCKKIMERKDGDESFRSQPILKGQWL